MEARHGMLGRVWIADRGMARPDNRTWVPQDGRRYIIGAAKSELKQFALELARPDDWRVVHEGVEVKLSRHPETGESVILCRSADRRSKERAMHDKFSRRIEETLGRLAAGVACAKKRIDPAIVNRQIGRILQQNQRSAARFAITLEPDGCPAGFRLGVVYNAAFDDWAALSEGAYLLRSNIEDWSDRQLWKAYIQLTQAEDHFPRFRALALFGPRRSARDNLVMPASENLHKARNRCAIARCAGSPNASAVTRMVGHG